MSSFTTPIRVEYIDGDRWRLLETFAYHVGSEDSQDVIVVPAGFVTDFASIPRIFWALYPPTGPWAAAAVIHDYLYAEAKRPREECDQIFFEGMAVLGVPFVRRHMMHRLVRMFGGPAYGRPDAVLDLALLKMSLEQSTPTKAHGKFKAGSK